jgi:predicted Rossmann-fold nucleotide-binding protein
MTGKDPVLNRRIASIFLNDLENFISVFSGLPTLTETDTLKFLIHKHSPSFIIFELESLLASYNSFLDRKINHEIILASDIEFQEVITKTKLKIDQLRQFIAGLEK